MMRRLVNESNYFPLVIYEATCSCSEGYSDIYTKIPTTLKLYVPASISVFLPRTLSFYSRNLISLSTSYLTFSKCVSISEFFARYWQQLLWLKWNQVCRQNTSSYDRLGLQSWHKYMAWVSQTSARTLWLAKPERNLDISECVELGWSSPFSSNFTKWSLGTVLLGEWSLGYYIRQWRNWSCANSNCRNSRPIHALFVVLDTFHSSAILVWKTSIAQLWSCGLWSYGLRKWRPSTVQPRRVLPFHGRYNRLYFD